MNGSFYENPTFPGAKDENEVRQEMITPPGNINYDSLGEEEQSYIENILRLNRGKKAKAYVSYPDSVEWRDKVYEGLIEQAGRDHLIMSNPDTGKWYLIRIIYLNYVEFDEKINYSYPFAKI